MSMTSPERRFLTSIPAHERMLVQRNLSKSKTSWIEHGAAHPCSMSHHHPRQSNNLLYMRANQDFTLAPKIDDKFLKD
jgi:hypothetical protein